jgi:acyl-coenzyme A thioesterase PaaI-like protein
MPPESLAMPRDYRLRFDHEQCRTPARPQSGEPYPEETIGSTDVDTTFLRPSKDYDLVAQGDDLHLKLQAALEPGTKEGKQQKDGVAHGERRI